MNEDWVAHFPALQEVTDTAGREALAAGREVVLKPGDIAFRLGDACSHYLLVIEGSVKVRELGTSGREIILYRVQDGESCVLTTACLMAGGRYSAEAIAERPTRAVLIPAAAFQHALGHSEPFRRFVFHDYGQRLSELLELIEDIAFRRLDARLAERLLELAGEAPELHITHQELATELGSAREVISRQLKDMQRRGLVRLERGVIHLLDREALEHLAESD
ncbi:MAG: Crp/Fnr family transcriptional regulator [Gammaproteobacteria bacterium]|nr:MAG: Crp/Fnr family transcriptional regulator [Gammaproteobacteria bacterium]